MKLRRHFSVSGRPVEASIEGASLTKTGAERAAGALKKAAANIAGLTKKVMLAAAGTGKMFLDVKFRRLKDAYGMYFPATGVIKLDSSLIADARAMEKIMFHEAVHHIFETYYKDSWYYELFDEAAAVYFQNSYYPDDYIFHKLVTDRFGENKFAAAYYILDRIASMKKEGGAAFIFGGGEGARTVKLQKKVVDGLIDEEYEMAESLYERLIRDVDILIIDERARKCGGGYGLIYRQKQMYSPMIAYLPPKSIGNLNFRDIFIKVTKVPERFSKKFILRDPDPDYLGTIAELYAQAAESIPVIKEKVFNASVAYGGRKGVFRL